MPKWVVKKVEAKPDFILDVTFESGKNGKFDIKPLMDKYPYNKLTKELFTQAKIVGGSVAWNDEIDIAPEILYEGC